MRYPSFVSKHKYHTFGRIAIRIAKEKPTNLHGHGRPAIFLVITLMAMGNALLLQLCQSFAIDVNTAGAGLGNRVVLEDAPHVME